MVVPVHGCAVLTWRMVLPDDLDRSLLRAKDPAAAGSSLPPPYPMSGTDMAYALLLHTPYPHPTQCPVLTYALLVQHWRILSIAHGATARAVLRQRMGLTGREAASGLAAAPPVD
eukprot:611573-Rhodomonas_salina.1